MIVAIDGPAGSGKSTTARGVARHMGYLYLDTGAMYRAVALTFLREDEEPTEAVAERVLSSLRIDIDHSGETLHVALDGEDVTGQIRTGAVSRMASRVSTLRPVREKLVEEQRRIAREYERQGGGVVLDGRDIGTVVFPGADVKIFMVAAAEERARRRHRDLEAQGETVPFEQVLAEIQERDAQDQERALAPLKRAEDAVELDTTRCTVEEQVQFVVERIRERQESG